MKKKLLALTFIILLQLSILSSSGIWSNMKTITYQNSMISEIEVDDGESNGNSIYPSECSGDISNIKDMNFIFDSYGTDQYGRYHGVDCRIKISTDTGTGSDWESYEVPTTAKQRAIVKLYIKGNFDKAGSGDFFKVTVELYQMIGITKSVLKTTVQTYTWDVSWSGGYAYYSATTPSNVAAGTLLYAKVTIEVHNDDTSNPGDLVYTDFDSGTRHISIESVSFEQYSSSGGGKIYL